MDTRLINGDHALDPRGIPARIGGDGELWQRALIRLAVPKGSLAGLPGFGSELRKLRSARPAFIKQLARGYVQEALGDMRECRVSGVDVIRDDRDGDRLRIAVTLTRNGERNQLEVTVS